jgi:hypothetical protein
MCGSGPNVLAKRGRKIESPRVLCERFVLIGAMNPCPCGWYGDPVKECTCSNAMVSRYQADQRRPPDLRPVAGPRRSSIGQPSEAHVEVPRVEAGSASRTKSGPTSGWASRRTCSSRTGAINELSWSSPHLQAGADDRRPFEASGQAWRGVRRSRRRILHFVQDRPGRGDPIPASAAGLIFVDFARVPGYDDWQEAEEAKHAPRIHHHNRARPGKRLAGWFGGRAAWVLYLGALSQDYPASTGSLF